MGLFIQQRSISHYCGARGNRTNDGESDQVEFHSELDRRNSSITSVVSFHPTTFHLKPLKTVEPLVYIEGVAWASAYEFFKALQSSLVTKQ